MITLTELNELYETISREHRRNLDKYGVVLPPLRKTDDEFNLLALQLVWLRKHLGELVRKEDITALVQHFVPDASGDQQPRQLKYKGWDVRCSGKSGDTWSTGDRVPNGHYVLESVKNPSSEFLKKSLKRAGRLAAEDWETLLAVYDHRCGVCKNKARTLEKGHKDPAKPDELDNLMPMCPTCNNWISNNVVVDDEGRVTALANSKLVLKSSTEVQREIYLELKARFK
jgi:hypothetical protein